jgi:hypothetical protein
MTSMDTSEHGVDVCVCVCPSNLVLTFGATEMTRRGKRKTAELNDDDDAVIVDDEHQDKRPCVRSDPESSTRSAWASSLVVGSMLDALDSVGMWYPSRVDQTSARYGVLVHFIGWERKWDTWIQRSSPRLAEVGTHTTTAHIHKIHITALSDLEAIHADGQLDVVFPSICTTWHWVPDTIKAFLEYGADPTTPAAAAAFEINRNGDMKSTIHNLCASVRVVQVNVATEALFGKDDAALLPYGISDLIASWVL